MAERPTPEAIHKFFSDLDPGPVSDDDYAINYASPAVVRMGLESAKMLLAIRKISDLVDQHPEQAVNLIRQWIYSEQ